MKKIVTTLMIALLAALPAVASDRIPVLSGDGDATVEVPVLMRGVDRGAIIQAEDIDWIELPERKVRRGTALYEDKIVGMVAQRRMKQGNQIPANSLKRPRIIERGGLVSMIYKSRNMELKTMAIALDDGSEGDVIRIRNESSGKTILAKVLRNGDVVVNYDTATAG